MDDKRVRLTAFRWLEEQVARLGDVLPRSLLVHGFELNGERVPLISQQGIFKPKVLAEIPISITTTVHGPYDDQMTAEGLMIYKYRGKNPNHPDNRGLREALCQSTPLIYFHGVVPGKYVAVWPVFIVGDNPKELSFTVAVDDRAYLDAYPRAQTAGFIVEDSQDVGRRQYITTLVKKRLHQHGFRERVLDAYKEQCALCRLRHEELLDAAHIIPDGEPGGEAIVTNGIALCKLHHAAFDGFFLGIRPDYVIEVRKDILEEDNGPMLTHGLQGLHGNRIWLPRAAKSRPSQERLDLRFDRFMTIGRGLLK